MYTTAKILVFLCYNFSDFCYNCYNFFIINFI
uniref:E2-like protein n=1 Tax=Siphoviridae sp. ctZ1O5 TaxID=2825555 RepID=A0A8S5PDW8_9CAUD|nr:MAG TPA: E2-like protein [Siphoviridae sp. ctZ1O5]